MPPPPVLVGRYALYGEIAAGGMATVHFGRLLGEAGFSRIVAVKRLHAHLAKDPEFAVMFLDEARLAARVQHPNVVPTLDVVAQEGELYLVLEYVHGESLARLARALRRAGQRVPLRFATTIVTQVLLGLHAAHEATSERGEPLGIVHRDVSPQNVMVDLDGAPRVLDFGVAKAAGRIQTTREGQIKGKIAYMAPEQARAGTTDRRTDIYGASIILWELLAGERLFSGANEAMVLSRLLEGVPRPPSAINPEVPPDLDAIVMRGLSSDPAARWQTAREMSIALEEASPLASARQLGDWVRDVAGAELAARAEAVREIERATKETEERLRESHRVSLVNIGAAPAPIEAAAPMEAAASRAPAIEDAHPPALAPPTAAPETAPAPIDLPPLVDEPLFPIDDGERTEAMPFPFHVAAESSPPPPVVEPPPPFADLPTEPLPDPTSQVSNVTMASPGTAPPPASPSLANLAQAPRVRARAIVLATMGGLVAGMLILAVVRPSASNGGAAPARSVIFIEVPASPSLPAPPPPDSARSAEPPVASAPPVVDTAPPAVDTTPPPATATPRSTGGTPSSASQRQKVRPPPLKFSDPG